MKDVIDQEKACIMGAEIDNSPYVRGLGLTTVGAPAQKRLALAFVSLTLASMHSSTDALQASLIGGWVNAVLYRRPTMSLIQDLYKTPLSQVQETPKLVHLTRSMAQELVMLSVLCPFFATDISAMTQPRCFSADSSDAKGAVVSCALPKGLSVALYRTGRKKTSYSRMTTRQETLMRKLDWLHEELPGQVPQEDEDTISGPERPRAFNFHFIEICGGAGEIRAGLRRGLLFRQGSHTKISQGEGCQYLCSGVGIPTLQ